MENFVTWQDLLTVGTFVLTLITTFMTIYYNKKK